MNFLRKILFPVSLLYGLIVKIRNVAFTKGILSSKSFDIPIIAVGNLNVGGTGKSPMIEYLIRLLHASYQTAVLSRGYGRKTKGFFLAKPDCTAVELGDEPYQFFRKFKNLVVAVDEKRVRGIETLRQLKPELELVLLDDAFQHRYVNAGIYVLLTAYDNLYVDDFLLPTGNLRESRNGAERADLIMVSKCPEGLSYRERAEIIKRISPQAHQTVFFSTIAYDHYIYSKDDKIKVSDLTGIEILLVTGIANPKPLLEFLRNQNLNVAHIKFADHQDIDAQAQKRIVSRFEEMQGDKKLILTTEKDFVRNFLKTELPVYYLPVSTKIMEEQNKFNEIIENYVRKKLKRPPDF